MPDKLRFWALVLVAAITALDLINVVLVRTIANEMPTTAGDVAKVGIGILGGAFMTKRS